MILMRTRTRSTSRSIFYSLFFLFPVLLPAQDKVSKVEAYLQSQKLVNIKELDATILSDLKYGTTDNFTKTVLYDTLLNIYLHPVAAGKLVKAQRYLKGINPDFSLLVYDAVRPLSVQKKMYKVVQNTPYALYVANPVRTGLHNYGMAVDLTICDKQGIPLDMGTAFDFFGKAAGINKEQELVNEDILTRQQVKNRKLLRKVMVQAGFLTIRGEWWHFNAVSLNEAKRSYRVIE